MARRCDCWRCHVPTHFTAGTDIYRDWWKSSAFKSLEHMARVQEKPREYMIELCREFTMLELTWSHEAVLAAINHHRKLLHEAEWDPA